MQKITIDRTSLIPRFLETYMPLPHDICKLRLAFVGMIFMLTVFGLNVGSLAIGTWILIDATVIHSFDGLNAAPYLFTCMFFASIGWVITIGILAGKLCHRIVTRIVDSPDSPDSPDSTSKKVVKGTFGTIKEMYYSLKEKYCLYIEYK